MKITCNIIFNNNPNKVFYPGQNVIGQIELKFPEPIKVKGISYIFGGKAQTKFSIKRGKTRTYYTGKEPYFEQQVHLVSNGRDEQLVEAGTYNYPFCQEFPSDVPSSIEASSGRHCHARYSIKVVIDKPYWFNTEFTEYFTHIRPLDLNIFPLFHGPIVKNDSKTYYWGGFCVPFESEPIHVSVRLPSGGYAPGQQIDVTVNVDNKSNVNPAFDVNLVQHFNLKTEDLGLIGIKEKEKEFFIVENRNVYTSRAGSKNEFESSLVIPPLPPTDQQNSKIFQMKYYVSVVWYAGSLHKRHEISMPIIIGTYPYVKKDSKFHENGFSSSNPFPKNDPPTYAEFKSNKVAFRPVYHVYRYPVVEAD